MSRYTNDDDDNDSLLWNDSAIGNRPDVDFDVSAGKTTKHLSPVERLREIERREKKARKLEQELRTKESAQNALWGKYKGEKNWPFSFWKLAHHSIGEDIPIQYQGKVRKMYFLWILNAFALVWNCFCYIMWSAWPEAKSNDITLSSSSAVVMLAIFYVCVGLPFSWLWWYKRYYNTYAGKMNNGRLGLRYFANFGIHCIFTALMATGYENIASAGFLAMLKCIAHVASLGMLLLISFVLWVMVALGSIWLIRKQHIDYGMQIAGKYVSDQQAAGKDAFGNNKRVLAVAKGVLQ